MSNSSATDLRHAAQLEDRIESLESELAQFLRGRNMRSAEKKKAGKAAKRPAK